jgi:hypothetical protein
MRLPTIREEVILEHESLRSLLRAVLVHAARARDGDLAAGQALALDIDELCRALRRHEEIERARILPLIAALDGSAAHLRAILDEAHADQARAADELRDAADLFGILAAVGALAQALAVEEDELPSGSRELAPTGT